MIKKTDIKPKKNVRRERRQIIVAQHSPIWMVISPS